MGRPLRRRRALAAGKVAPIEPITEDERHQHRFVRSGTFFAEAGVALAAWALVSRAAALPGPVVLVGGLLTPPLLAALFEATVGGTPLRLLTGLRVVATSADEDHLRPPGFARSLLRQVVRLGALVALQSIAAGGGSRSYDSQQRRWSQGVVIGRATAGRVATLAAMSAGATALGAALAFGPESVDDAWPLIASIGALSALVGAVFLLVSVVGLAAYPPPPGDRLSLVSSPTAGAVVDSDISLGLTGVNIVGTVDSKPVPRVSPDGTTSETVGSSEQIITRKRKPAGEVAEP